MAFDHSLASSSCKRGVGCVADPWRSRKSHHLAAPPASVRAAGIGRNPRRYRDPGPTGSRPRAQPERRAAGRRLALAVAQLGRRFPADARHGALLVMTQRRPGPGAPTRPSATATGGRGPARAGPGPGGQNQAERPELSLPQGQPERPVTAPLALPGCHSESVTVTGSHRDGGTAVRHRDWQAAVCAPA